MRYWMLATLAAIGCGPGDGGGGEDLGVGDLTMVPMSCANGMKDGDETDLDCGGSCGRCGDGKGCKRAADCESMLCANNLCVAPACDDGIKNGSETDVDCGGGTCAGCADGKPCLMGTDCASGQCTNNRCMATADMSPPPDLATGDLATPGCMNDQQCVLAHAKGKCAMMSCAIDFCDLNWADCDKIVGNGCESDSLNDPANCNFCGTSCLGVVHGKGVCQNGACAIGSCNVGFANCDGMFATGCATDIANDVANCGGCGKACNLANAMQACVNGACVLQGCQQGFANCDNDPKNGCEVGLQGDPSNCGKCGTVCPMNAPECNGGLCAAEDFPPIYLLYLLTSP